MINNIPLELKQHKKWVGVVEGSKIPIDVNNGKFASSTDPKTWTTFDNCLSCIPNISNLGYVFTKDDNIIGIDIDKGLDDYGLINEWTLDIIKRCNSYTEFSKSGRGVHIFIKGQLPFNGRNANGIEIYNTDRYFICTGDVILNEDIKENQSAIDYIVDTFFKDEYSSNVNDNRVYNTIFKMDVQKNEKIYKFVYPKIQEGSRHITLVSIGGMLTTAYNNLDLIYEELLKLNDKIFDNPLPEKEVYQITRSLRRYV